MSTAKLSAQPIIFSKKHLRSPDLDSSPSSSTNKSTSFTPRKAIKIASLLNPETDSSSSNLFPIFSTFTKPQVRPSSPQFQSSTTQTNNTLLLQRPISPFESLVQAANTVSATPKSSPSSECSSVLSTPKKSNCYEDTINVTPLTPISSPATEEFKSFQQIQPDDYLATFESQLGVLDFGPLSIKLINTTSVESKLLNFDLTPNDVIPDLMSGESNNESVSKSTNFFLSRFVSNPCVNKDRRFLCAVCDKRFKTAGHLTRHRKIHSGEKKFVCQFEGCNSKFSRKDNCMQHYRAHFSKLKSSSSKKSLSRAKVVVPALKA